MTGVAMPWMVNAQAGIVACPRFVATVSVAGRAPVTSSGCMQAGHEPLLSSLAKAGSAPSARTFMVPPPAQVTRGSG
jgi:hypothetical protein